VCISLWREVSARETAGVRGWDIMVAHAHLRSCEWLVAGLAQTLFPKWFPAK